MLGPCFSKILNLIVCSWKAMSKSPPYDYRTVYSQRVPSYMYSVLTRPQPCGIPAKKMRWRTQSQEDVPVRAQEQASSLADF